MQTFALDRHGWLRPGLYARNAAARRSAAQPGRAPASNGIEAMVSCAHCGIYMPRSEALLIGKRTWCCEDHARLGPGADRQS